MKVVVAAWVGSANLGDELVFSALVRKLRARGTRIVVPSLDPRATEQAHRGVRAIGHADASAVLAAVGQADAVVLGGGGLLQNETSWFNLPYHLSRVWWGRLRSRPFAVVGIGAGRLSGSGPAFVRASLRGATGVAARDRASAQLLRCIGVRPVTLAADLAVSLPSPGVGPEDRVVACLRPWTSRRGRLPVSARTDPTPTAMVARLAEQLDGVAGRLGLPIRLVAFQRAWDELLHERVAARMHAPVELVAPSLDGILAEVARSRLVIAMRYHAGIAALLGGRPAVLIGYSPKLDALATDFGHQGRLLAWDHEALGGLAAQAEDVAGAEHGSLELSLQRLRKVETGNDRVLDALLASR